ncbi:hypothetical protein FRAHR75_570015 [Frankia sp. Hr75.2]|nr:hypothetical protein FRAHR75_570015 [Frankia sp. Hr75.2]
MKVGPDVHARVENSLYSLPWRYLGQTVQARSTATMVQFFVAGQLVKTHPRKVRGKQTDLGDYPPEKIAFHMRTPTWCRAQAEKVGPACVQLVGGLLAENALYRLRAAQGVLGLADRHDPARLEAACAKALAVGDPSYRTVKGTLRRRHRNPAHRGVGRRRRSGGVPPRPRPAAGRRHPPGRPDPRRRRGPGHHARPDQHGQAS